MTMTTGIQVSNPIEETLKRGGEVFVRGLDKTGFEEVCASFPDYRIEREKTGEISIMAPVKGMGGFREGDLIYFVSHWCKTVGNGKVSSPSGGFDLPNGATKSPDVAWVSGEKLAQINPEKAESNFLPLVPDFVAEIRSESDRLKKLQYKMKDSWIANGVCLAWLIDPFEEKAYIYRTDGSIEIVKDFDKKLSGEDVMPGFELDLGEFRLFDKK